jgi:hypothetical protein
MTVNLYAPPPNVVVNLSPLIGQNYDKEPPRTLSMQDAAYELPRRPLFRHLGE